MKKPEPDTDWMNIGVTTLIFLIPSGILIASIAASFSHIKDWALDHAPEGAHDWQGWAFACIVELIPIFGVLLLWKLRRANHDLTVPRWILGAGFGFSMAGQIAYAGGIGAGLSRLIVAAGPSVAGLVLTEVVLWLFRVVSEKATLVSGLGHEPDFVPPPPKLVPPPAPVMSTRTSDPDVPGHGHQDTDLAERVSPWTQPPPGWDMSQDTAPDIGADVPRTAEVGQADTPQVTATVHPSRVHPTDKDTDTDVLPAGPGDTSPLDPPDMSRDSEDTDGGTPGDPADVDTDVHPDAGDPDTDTADPDTDTGPDMDIDPRAAEALSMREDKGMTNQQIADEFGCSTKTVQRLIKQALDARKAPELAGAR